MTPTQLNFTRKSISEYLILSGGIIFAAGTIWTPILGYLAISLGFIGICLDFDAKEISTIVRINFVLISLFILWGLVLSLTVAIRPGEAFATVFAYAAHWLFPFALGYWIKDKFRVGLVYVFAALIILVGILSLGAYLNFYHSPNLSKEGMIWGLHHHIAFAAMLLMAVHIAYGSAMVPKSSNKKTIALLSIGAFIMLLVVLSGSRAYWMAGAITVTCATIYNAIIGRQRILSLSFIGVGVIIAALAVLAFPQIRQRIISSGIDNASYIDRKNMAIMGGEMIKDHPFTGIGPGQVPYVKVYYDRMAQMKLPIETGYMEKKHLHNMYLQIGAEFGIIGFMLCLGIAITSLWLLVRAAAIAGNGFSSGIAMAVFWSIITLAIGEIFDCLMRGPTVAMMIFWLIGISAGFLNNNQTMRNM